MNFHAPVNSLLEQALPRLRRQPQYARPLAQGGTKSRQLEQWLCHASENLSNLVNAKAVFHPLNASSQKDKVLIEQKLVLDAPDLATKINDGGQLSAYLLTLGYDQTVAFEQIDHDYMIHHVQTELGREMLFALGRLAHQKAASAEPNRQLKRISILMEGQPDSGARLWDATSVQQLLSFFGNGNPGVSVTDSGCFQPLHSLLGLVISRSTHTG